MIRALMIVVALSSLVAGAAEPYRQAALFEWDRTTIDVIVLPPGHGQIANDGGVLPAGSSDLNPVSNSYLRAAERGVALWPAAVRSFGPAWLAATLDLNVYVAGRDPIPSGTDAEILVAFHESGGPVLGTSWGNGPCLALVAKAYHASFTPNDVTNLAAHEVGHCLGLAHLDLPDPRSDLMQAVYPHPDGLRSTPVHCPSNLNVAVLERVFRGAAGRGPGGGTVSLASTDYRQPGSC